MKIRIEWVSTVEFDYPYLEVFYKNSVNPFLDIGINDDKQLNFKFYKINENYELSIKEIEYILKKSKEFLLKALKNEADFQKWTDENNE